MMAITHVTSAVAVVMGASIAGTGHPAEVGVLTWTALGSLLPDIDHPHSTIGRRLIFISAPLSALVGHRGVTHSFVAMALCLAAGLYYGSGWHAVDLATGYALHLIADLFTKSGIPLLWPRRDMYAVPLVRTGDGVDIALATVLLASIILVVMLYPAFYLGSLEGALRGGADIISRGLGILLPRGVGGLF